MTNREFAWRVFAGEYNNATLEIPPSEERAPGYLITPLGARINRIYIVGVLTEIDKLEKNGNVHYRARVSDRTGVFYIYAGQYDPEVCKALSKLEPPQYIAIVGKSKKYSPTEGISYISIRPESITVVDKSIRDYWLLDTCNNMKGRLEAVIETQQMTEPDLETLINLGFESELSKGVIDALGHYDKIDVEFYKNMLVDVLRYLVINDENGYSRSNEGPNDIPDLDLEFKTGEEIKDTGDLGDHDNPDADTNAVDDADDVDDFEFEPLQESSEDSTDLIGQGVKLMEIIEMFKGDEYINGVPWHILIAKADSEGIDKNLIEDIVNNLIESGKVYEPMLGRIKLTGC